MREDSEPHSPTDFITTGLVWTGAFPGEAKSYWGGVGACRDMSLSKSVVSVASIVSKQLKPGSDIIKLFSWSTQLSIKFQMLISIKISRHSTFFRLRQV